MQKKVAIIGSGYMAEQHIKALLDIPDCIVVGIVSRNSETASSLADRYSIPLIASSIKSLYQETGADGVIVAVNEPEAVDVVSQCIDFDWKIMSEKPLGLFLSSTISLREKAGDRSQDIFVAMNRRHYQSTKTAKELIKNDQDQRIVTIMDQENITGAIKSGQPKEVVERWMVANSIHLIDYFSMFCRGKVEKSIPSLPWSPKAPFIFQTNLFFESGDIGCYTAMWDAPGPWSVRITTKKQMFEMQPLEQLHHQIFPEKTKHKIELKDFDLIHKPGLYIQCQEFVAALFSKPHNLPSLSDYIKTHALVELMYQDSLDLSKR